MSSNKTFHITCDPALAILAASKSIPISLRRAVDSSGRVGYLYNAYSDQVIPSSNRTFHPARATASTKPACFLKPTNPIQSYNLLKQVNMHDGLRVSVELGLTEPNGVGSLINYDKPIDKYTRILCYSYFSKTQYLPDEEFTSLNAISLPETQNNATHIIVLVNWGIDATVILQLPPHDEEIVAIDYALQKICTSLQDIIKTIQLSDEDLSALDKLQDTHVFSNIEKLNSINTILDFYVQTRQLSQDINSHQPHNYHLYPIMQSKFIDLQVLDVNHIEYSWIPLSSCYERLQKARDTPHSNQTNHFRAEYDNIRADFDKLTNSYKKTKQTLRTLVQRFRRGQIEEINFRREVDASDLQTLKKNIEALDDHWNKLVKKENFIKDLAEKGFEYQNAREKDIKSGDDAKILERKLLDGMRNTRIICSDDYLHKTQQSKLYTLFGRLQVEHENKRDLKLIYLDFSYTSNRLKDILFLSTNDKKESIDVRPQSAQPQSQRAMTYESINILLLGESGVGKSTFINAFTNYIKHDELEKAEEKPVVLIPVSFTMTTDDNFTERTIKHEGSDNFCNEDLEHIGQSVTQHCKSYVFKLKNGEENPSTVLRIIDTPGIGDSQGSSQDDVNLQHILSYINSLSHLNAICILLKPNNARLTVLFRMCFTQLIDMLGEKICDRIIFCFTNSRSTFYSPGNTGPLLKALIDSLPTKSIRFAKENTFCFDSESFRYLVAKLNRFDFSESEQKDYNESWKKSASESNRLLDCIYTTMHKPIHHDQPRSVKHAQLTINLLVRPILESIRNTLRNIILLRAGVEKDFIQLSPKIIKGTTAICLKCKRTHFEVGRFTITMDGLHVFHNRCRTCRCDSSHHYPIDYELRYEVFDNSEKYIRGDMEKLVDELGQASAEMACFLCQTGSSSGNDPFLSGFQRMVKEEDYICKKKNPNVLNSELLEDLTKLQNIYERKRKKISQKGEKITLDVIHKMIKTLRTHEMIEMQMVAISQWHKFMIKYYEYDVPL